MKRISLKNRSKLFLSLCTFTLLFTFFWYYNDYKFSKFDDYNLNRNTKFPKVCRDVFEIRHSNSNQNSSMIKSAVDLIREGKEEKTFLHEEFYSALSREGMSIIDDVQPFHGLNRSNITIFPVCR